MLKTWTKPGPAAYWSPELCMACHATEMERGDPVQLGARQQPFKHRSMGWMLKHPPNPQVSLNTACTPCAKQIPIQL